MAELQMTEHHVLLWGKSPADARATAGERGERTCASSWIAKKVSGVFFAPFESSGEKDEINRRIAELLDQLDPGRADRP